MRENVTRPRVEAMQSSKPMSRLKVRSLVRVYFLPLVAMFVDHRTSFLFSCLPVLFFACVFISVALACFFFLFFPRPIKVYPNIEHLSGLWPGNWRLLQRA